VLPLCNTVLSLSFSVGWTVAQHPTTNNPLPTHVHVHNMYVSYLPSSHTSWSGSSSDHCPRFAHSKSLIKTPPRPPCLGTHVQSVAINGRHLAPLAPITTAPPSSLPPASHSHKAVWRCARAAITVARGRTTAHTRRTRGAREVPARRERGAREARAGRERGASPRAQFLAAGAPAGTSSAETVADASVERECLAPVSLETSRGLAAVASKREYLKEVPKGSAESIS